MKTGVTTRRRSSRWSAPAGVVASGVILLFFMAFAVLGDSVAPYNATRQDLLLGVTGPSPSHLLGTDELGRDVLSRVIAGARSALIGPFVITLGVTMLGTALGTIAGFGRGLFDTFVTRFADLIYALPALLVAIVVTGLVGGGYTVAILVVTVFSLPTCLRITRGATLSQARLAYVDAARTLGMPARRIIARHIVPAIFPPIVATALLTFVAALVSLSSLSFLGIGVPPGAADWGRMISDGRAIAYGNLWALVSPAICLALVAIAMTLMGDWLYERLSRSDLEHD